MTQKQLSKELLNTARRWLICFAVIGGFMFYHSRAPWLTIIMAGVGTLAAMEIVTYFKVSRGDQG